MTVEVQDPFNSYTAAPGATVFPYTFKIVSPADLIATIDDIVIDLAIDFSLSGVGGNDGGDLTLFVPLTGGEAVLLKRQMTFNRETDYQQNGDFNAPVVNNDFDRIWLALQQLGQDLKRSIKVAFTETTDQTIPVSPAARANKALVFDASGNVTASADDYNDQAADAAASAAAALDAKNGALTALGLTEDARDAAAASAIAAATFNPALYVTKAGGDTFTVSPIVPTPTTSNQAANKAYVDGRVSVSSGFKNLLINGNFSINQRGYASGAATTGANQYVLDRWRVVTSGQNLTFAAAGNGNAVTAPAGGIEQVIEGSAIDGGNYVLGWEGTATATVNGTARMKGEVFTLPANTNVVVRFTGGTVSRAQIEAGDSLTSFERRHPAIEMMLCQRYFQITLGSIRGSYGDSGTNGYAIWFFKVPMRATPTMAGGISGTYGEITRDSATVTLVSGYPYFNGGVTASAEL